MNLMEDSNPLKEKYMESTIYKRTSIEYLYLGRVEAKYTTTLSQYIYIYMCVCVCVCDWLEIWGWDSKNFNIVFKSVGIDKAFVNLIISARRLNIFIHENVKEAFVASVFSS